MNHCKDGWRMHIPPEKLSVYKQMLDEGMIFNPHVTYMRASGITYVEYDTEFSLKAIRAEMKQRCAEKQEYKWDKEEEV